ncbi:MAG: regulatory protein RecX [Chromatiales bacterium]
MALSLLARREHSREELTAKLLRRGGAPETVASVLDALSGERLQSDGRYAEAFARQRAERGYGPVRIVQELRRKGIETKRAQAAIATVEESWLERARQTRAKRFGRAVPGTTAERVRQMRFLEYRGFAAEDIRRAVNATDDE